MAKMWRSQANNFQSRVLCGTSGNFGERSGTWRESGDRQKRFEEAGVPDRALMSRPSFELLAGPGRRAPGRASGQAGLPPALGYVVGAGWRSGRGPAGDLAGTIVPAALLAGGLSILCAAGGLAMAGSRTLGPGHRLLSGHGQRYGTGPWPVWSWSGDIPATTTDRPHGRVAG